MPRSQPQLVGDAVQDALVGLVGHHHVQLAERPPRPVEGPRQRVAHADDRLLAYGRSVHPEVRRRFFPVRLRQHPLPGPGATTGDLQEIGLRSVAAQIERPEHARGVGGTRRAGP